MNLSDPGFLSRFREHERWIMERHMADLIVDENMPEPRTPADIAAEIDTIRVLIPATEAALADWQSKTSMRKRLVSLRADLEALTEELLAATRGQA